ncbi:MAG: type VI secretion system contractile sheath large subunit, partial [Caulobacteraceae bacterium]
MAEVLQERSERAAEAVTVDDFSELLKKEFKPTNDARKSRIEQAVQTMAQQALADAKIIGDDVFTT